MKTRLLGKLALILLICFSDSSVKAAPAKDTTAAVGYRFEDLNLGLSPWEFLTFEGGHRFANTTVIARWQYGTRFDRTASQVEFEAVPKLNLTTYLHLSLSSADGIVFPKRKAGLEIFKALGVSWEASAGVRYFEFEPTSATVLTGSVAKYLGAYFFLLRMFHTPDSSLQGTSFTFQSRKYFSDDNFAAVTIGGGREVSYLGSTERVRVSKVKSINSEYFHRMSVEWAARVGAGFETESFDASGTRERVAMHTMVERSF